MSGAVGCGAQDEQVPELDEVSQHFVDLAEARCDRLIRCGGATDKQACVELSLWGQGLDPEVSNYKAGFANGSLSFDTERALACVEANREAACSQQLPECEGLYSGKGEFGDSCWLDEQCRFEYCEKDPQCDLACCEGVCEAPFSTVPLGEACTQASPCVEGAYCDPGTQLCTALAGEGDPCQISSECEAGLECDGTCSAPPSEGEACGELSCVGVLTCDDGVCRTPLGLGESCTGPSCMLGLTCDPSSNTCVESPKTGAACTEEIGCAPLNSCVNGVCQAYGGLGEPCEFFDCAAGYYCNGTCQPLDACFE